MVAGKKAITRATKSPTALRTIGEVSKDLSIPQHVLRFWETKFPQVLPAKHRGKRRYYRPNDINLLRRIRDLLYDDGYTIKGVQKILNEDAIDKEKLQTQKQSSKLEDGKYSVNRDSLAEVLTELKHIRRLM